MELAGQADNPAEVDGSVSETGPEEPACEGAPVTGVSEDQKLPDVHGKNVWIFCQYDQEAKNIRPIWCIVLSDNPVPLLSDVNLAFKAEIHDATNRGDKSPRLHCCCDKSLALSLSLRYVAQIQTSLNLILSQRQ